MSGEELLTDDAQGMSFMAIGFLYPSEINSNRSRNHGAAIAMVTNWVGVYIVVSITPIGIQDVSKSTFNGARRATRHPRGF